MVDTFGEKWRSRLVLWTAAMAFVGTVLGYAYNGGERVLGAVWNVSGTVHEVLRKVNDTGADVSSLKVDVGALKFQFSNINYDVGNLRTQVQQLEEGPPAGAAISSLARQSAEFHKEALADRFKRETEMAHIVEEQKAIQSELKLFGQRLDKAELRVHED